MRRFRGFALLIALLPFSAVQVAWAASPDKTLTGEVESNLNPVTSAITLKLPDPLGAQTLVVSTADIKSELLRAKPQDLVTVQVDDLTRPRTIVSLASLVHPVNLSERLGLFAACLVFLVFVAALFTRCKPWQFLIGVDNRYSNSQSQIVLWFGAVASIYLTALVLRYVELGSIGGVGMPEHLIELTGLSALTFGGAKVIVAHKVAEAESAGRPSTKTPAAKSNLISDLVTNDSGHPDFGDFQMIVITVAAALVFVASALSFLGTLSYASQIMLPDIDSALLSGFGIGQGAYLVKKAALKLGEG